MHSQVVVNRLLGRLPARHTVRALLHPGSGRRGQTAYREPHAREVCAVAKGAARATRRVAVGDCSESPRRHQPAKPDSRRSRPGMRATSGRGVRAWSGGHRLRTRRPPCTPPNPGGPRKVVLRPAEGEEDPYRRHALLGGRRAEAPCRSVPAGGGGASVGGAGGAGEEVPPPILTTRFGNAVAVNTWDTYSWKPALAAACVIPARAQGAKPWQWAAAPRDGFHVLRHTYASIMLEAGETVVPWLVGSRTPRPRSPSVTMLTSCQRPVVRVAPPSSECCGSDEGDRHVGRDSPDSPQLRWRAMCGPAPFWKRPWNTRCMGRMA